MNTKTRVITAICLAVVMIPCFALGGILSIILSMLFGIIGTFEAIYEYNKKHSLSFLYVIIEILFSISMMIGVVLSINESKFWLYIVGGVSLVTIILNLLFSFIDKKMKLIDFVYYTISVFVISLGSISLSFIRNHGIENIFDISFNNINSFNLLLLGYVVLIPWITDIFAFLIGCKIGKHKLAPKISPKKTVEGAIAGITAAAIFGGIYLSIVFQASGIIDVILAVIVSIGLSIVGQCGDLIESSVKRSIGIKDFGKILPGHGGILDRFDSIIPVGIIAMILLIIGVNL